MADRASCGDDDGDHRFFFRGETDAERLQSGLADGVGEWWDSWRSQFDLTPAGK